MESNSQSKQVESLKQTIAQLVQQGLAYEEIAERVDRSTVTVVKYLAQFIQQGVIPVSSIVCWDIRQQIYQAMEQVGMARLKPIKALLPTNIKYEDISLVVASLRQNQEEQE
jgi:ATP-dependent DNA helicase RecQ